MSSLGPFITALSHFQWSRSQLANKRVHWSGAAAKDILKKNKKNYSPAAFAGWYLWHILSDKFLHLKGRRCPLGGKGIHYLKVDSLSLSFYSFFFFCCRKSSSVALFSFLRTTMEPQRFHFDFLPSPLCSPLLPSTPLHPLLLFFLLRS